ncbi:DUF3050 domain-containing protein [Haliangium sp.]|uniref:DUF3050 domain-containing protein n=1 Tax=Haliangium sp. TaxID=2663208 RepID=UPI003D10D75A
MHGLYGRLSTVTDLRRFMEHHVVCVWDFMSLVKSLQRDFGGWSLPWVPARDPVVARFLNEIVLDEESDDIGGRYLSHYELYLEAMDEVGADAAPARHMIEAVQAGVEVSVAAHGAGLPVAARRFLDTSLALLERSLPARAAVFYYGREQAIPPMFSEILAQLEDRGLRCPSMRAYLERHIECDGTRHGPMARALLDASLRGAGPEAAVEADDAARIALSARLSLWDAIEAELN